IISQMTSMGSSAATSSTKSHSPRSMTPLMISLTISRIRPCRWFTMRAEKALLISPRYWRCLGGSMLSMMARVNGRSVGGGSRISVPWRSEENSPGLLEMAFRSAYLVIAQKPLSLVSGCQYTGASRRSSLNIACGTACWNTSGSVRFTSLSRMRELREFAAGRRSWSVSLDDPERIRGGQMGFQERGSLIRGNEPIRGAHGEDLDQRESLAVELAAEGVVQVLLGQLEGGRRMDG